MRSIMRHLALGITLLTLIASPLRAQVKQTDCEREVDAKLTQTFGLAAAAGSVTYKKIMDRALVCMQGGSCSKSEAFVHLQEAMVDEEVIDLQRKKVRLMKAFAAQAGPRATACSVAALLPPLAEELIAINAQQLSRFEALAVQYFPGAKR